MKNSFTLIEMVVVIVILGLLASIATPMYFRHVDKAKVATAQTQIKLLDDALMDFKLDTGQFPTQSQGLRILVVKDTSLSKWNGPYLKPAQIPQDPWGNEYQYVIPGEHGDYDLFSYGADGQPGGDGVNADIGNWGEEEKSS